jgi:hypothetical protein
MLASFSNPDPNNLLLAIESNSLDIPCIQSPNATHQIFEAASLLTLFVNPRSVVPRFMSHFCQNALSLQAMCCCCCCTPAHSGKWCFSS